MTTVNPFAINPAVSSGEGNADLGKPRVGAHSARLMSVIDLGIQPQSFGGEVQPSTRELLFQFELLDDTVVIKGVEQNRIFSKSVKCPQPGRGMSEKSHMYAMFQAMDAAAVNGDFSQRLGTLVTLTLVQKDNGNIGFGNIAAFPPGVEMQAGSLPTFTFTPMNPDTATWKNLAPWIKKIILAAEDFQSTPLAGMVDAEGNLPEEQAAPQAAPQVAPQAAPQAAPQVAPQAPVPTPAPAENAAPAASPAVQQAQATPPLEQAAPVAPPAPPTPPVPGQ